MSIRHVSYRYQYGAALHEAGLNIVSAGLRVLRPELFSHRTEILVKEATAGPPPTPRHVLTLYAVTDEPIAFNLHPLGGPGDREDTLLVRAHVSFSLTDSQLGSVTRVGAIIEGLAHVTLEPVEEGARKARLTLLDFRIAEIRGEHPEADRAANDAVPNAVGDRSIDDSLDESLAHGLLRGTAEDDETLGRTFRAIMRYLIAVFLEGALRKTVVEFPVPPLNEIIEFEGLGVLPVQGAYVRNDSMYVAIGDDLGGPPAFPLGAGESTHLRVGMSESGIQRIVRALLPVGMDFDTQVGGDVRLHAWSRNLRIPDLAFDVQPGEDALRLRVHLAGEVYLRPEFRIPWTDAFVGVTIPFPIDPLTHYFGRAFARFLIDPPDGADPHLRVAVQPETRFFHDWYAFVATNYRELFSRELQNAVRKALANTVVRKFCKIPVLGWIVCGVVDVVAWALGAVLGTLLDLFLVVALNVLINTIGRIVADLVIGPDKYFEVVKLSQKKLRELLGVTVRSARLVQGDDSRGGELELRAWFEDMGLPVPPLPAPIEPLPDPVPPLPPTIPGLPTLPEYGPADYEPALDLAAPTWPDGATQRYRVTLAAVGRGGTEETIDAVTTIARDGGGWRLHEVMTGALGATLGERSVTFDDAGRPVRAETVSPGPDHTVREALDFATDPARVITSLGPDGAPNAQRAVLRVSGVPLVVEHLWAYRLAHTSLDVGGGTLVRAELSDPSAAANWARMIPVRVAITASQLAWAPDGGVPAAVDVWRIAARDEEGERVVFVARDGGGMLRLEGTTAQGDRFTMTRRA